MLNENRNLNSHEEKLNIEIIEKPKDYTVNIIAYNIHGLAGKNLHHRFFEYLEQFDIFILSETHVEKKNQENYTKKFKNFKIYWNFATRNSNRGRGIGGQLYGIRNDLEENGFKHVFSNRGNQDVLQCEFNSIRFEILPVYLRGANWNQDFENLKAAVDSSEGTGIVVGDHNIRIGEEQEQPLELLEDRSMSNIRRSKDKTITPNGKKYVEFCNNNGLVILNGRMPGDEEGKFTFLNRNGSSVIDVCAVSLNMLTYVKTFRVDEQIWSDHLPVILELAIPYTSQRMPQKGNLLPKLTWKEAKKETFHNNLNQQLCTLPLNPRLEDFIKTIYESYPSCLNNKKDLFKNKWFDKDCSKSRKKAMSTLNKFRKSDKICDKNAYVEQKKEYEKLCKVKKIDYYKSIAEKMDTVSDSKTWWKIAKEIRQIDRDTSCCISANILKTYFERLLNPLCNTEPMYYAPNNLTDLLLDREFSVGEIKEQLRNVGTNKAPGEDRVPYEFFMHATDEFLGKLCNAFTNILNGFDDFEIFRTGIIFPIHKKGNLDEVSNYRGITFMNCIGKLMIGMINCRIVDWLNRYQILNEYQAGFRKGYSTVDNIFNLSAIINIKLHDNKKVYAFFVDFKAAFDRVPRGLLIYKLHEIGLSSKITRFVEKIYENTRSAVWSGSQMSEYFDTCTGVKQGCLLSPTLFAIYLNDLHEHLEGGLQVDQTNIRLLMYADDIIIMSDNPRTLQQMIYNLESYCDKWGMEVNQIKSEIMVFRKGGKLSTNEKWAYKGELIRIVNEYKYLGLILTPKLSFTKHLSKKEEAAKIALNSTWKHFIAKPSVNLTSKWKMFLAVCRSIHSYGAQIWGNSYFNEVEKLYRYFIKKILKLPEATPNYVIALETGYEPGYIYTYSLHLQYLSKVLFDLESHRLPHILAEKLANKNLAWFNDYSTQLSLHNINSNNVKINKKSWMSAAQQLLMDMKANKFNDHLQKAQQSENRIYKYLDYNVGPMYCTEKFSQEQITLILKARGDLMWLNFNKYRTSNEQRCSLCNLGKAENLVHFIGRCPVLANMRVRHFNRTLLDQTEIISILNGGEGFCWVNLLNFLKEARKYRNMLIEEFNY